MNVYFGKTADLIKMLFWDAGSDGPKKHVLDGDPDLPTGRGRFLGKQHNISAAQATQPFPKLLSDFSFSSALMCIIPVMCV